jgi:DNA-binding NarL/FixJ family response regulator
MSKIRVLLAEDHTVVRQGLRQILESDAEIEIAGQDGDGRGAVESAKVCARPSSRYGSPA